MRTSSAAAMTALAGVLCGALSYTLPARHGAPDHASPTPVAATSSATPLTAEGLNLLPSETLRDWVTYGDHVVVAKLTSTRDLDTSDEEKKAGEGYIPRQVSFDVRRVVWSREGAPDAPDRVALGLDGSVFDATSTAPLRMEGQPALDKVGTEYVMVLTKLRASAYTSVPGWVALSPDSIVPISPSDPTTVTAGAGQRVSSAVSAVQGRTVDRVASLLAHTEADPFAVPYMAEPPDERAQLAIRARRDSAEVPVERAPGEKP